MDERPEKGTIREARRFLTEWLDRLGAAYIAASLPPKFRYPVHWDDPAGSAGETILKEAILPVCAERNLAFAAMIGSERGVNPELRGAGDMPGRADIRSVTNLCRGFPRNRFLVTMLSRENQHELAVAARKFPNLMVFGCWCVRFLAGQRLGRALERGTQQQAVETRCDVPAAEDLEGF